VRAGCLAVLRAASAAPSSGAEWQKALTRALSPGSVALLVEHRNEPGVRERWAAALKDDRAEVRAAAARVIHVSGSTWLLPDLVSALSHEASDAAAIEEIRAIGSLGDAGSDAALVAAATRLKLPAVDVVAETLGRVRGVEAFGQLAVLRSAGLSPSGYQYLARMAVRGGAGSANRAAMAAVRDSDVEAWEAVLEETRRAGHPIDAGVLKVALDIETPRFRALTYWHLAREIDRGGSLAPVVAERLESTPEALDQETSDLNARFALEVLQRTRGRTARDFGRRLPPASTIANHGMPFPFAYDDPLRRWLTAREQEAALPKGVQSWRPPPTKAMGPPETPMRLATLFPDRFASDLMKASGCVPGLQDLAGAMIDYGPDARPKKVSVADSGLSARCLEAAHALLLSALAPLGDVAPSVFLVVPLAPEVFACSDEKTASRANALARAPTSVGGRIQEPRKIVNVPPIYPEAAKREHVQGTVILEATISPWGCVEEVKVLQGVPMLNAAALNAVVRWRYTPTVLDGVPVPVIMTVTVKFRLSS